MSLARTTGAVWQMLPRFSKTHKAFAVVSTLSVCVSLLGLLFFGVLATRMNVDVDDGVRGRAVLGFKVASTVAQKLEGLGQDEAPAIQKKEGLRLTGGKFAVAPEFRDFPLIQMISQSGGTLVDTGQQADVLIEKSGPKWILHNQGTPQKTAATYAALSLFIHQMNEKQLNRSQEVSQVKGISFHSDDEQSVRRENAIAIKVLMLSLAVFLPLIVLTYITISANVGTIQKKRDQGELEVFSTTKSPLWTWMLADILGRAIIAGVLCCVIVLAASLFFGLKSWWSLPFFLISQISIISALSLFGSMQSIWYQHKIARGVVGALLNVLYLPVVPVFFLIFNANKVETALDQGLQISTRGYLNGNVPVLGWTFGQALNGMVITLLASLVLGAMCAKLIGWRVRKHRYRLAK